MTSRSWRTHVFTAAIATSACLMLLDPLLAGFGGRGGGGGGRVGGGGGGRVGGGGGGMSRPSISAPSRPSPSRPSPSRPSPSPRPSQPSTRPSLPSSRPSPSRPSGGFNPSTPSRPSLPSGGNNQRPSTGQRPNVSIPNLPSSRPSLPSGNRPSTLPGNVPGGNRPSTLPGNLPGGNRPSTLPGNLPGGRPSLPGGAGTRPGGLPSRPGSQPGGRPQPGDLGDFLGIDQPLRPSTLPGQPSTRPGGGGAGRPGDGSGLTGGGNRPDPGRPSTLPSTRPGVGDGRPGAGNGRPGGGDGRPGGGPGAGNRPDNRPGDGNRPDWVNRPGSGNNVINNRPNWVNIDNSTNVNINNRWSNAIINNSRPGRPSQLPATRRDYWNNWGGGVRHHWDYHRYHGCFNGNWWHHHPYPLPAWRCPYYRHHYSYWWRRPTWAAFGTWFAWSAAYSNTWSEPVYYDYGSGGNVVYQGDTVYVNEQPVASPEDFAMSAASLATVPPPEDPAQAEQDDWMPLGTFAMSTGENDINPTRVVQLVVNKQGIISGTLYNTQTDEAQAIQGQVDKQTQRVAFRIGDNQDMVAETGLYNLTQDEAPVLVHFGADRTETYLLVRLEEPTDSQSGSDSTNTTTP